MSPALRCEAHLGKRICLSLLHLSPKVDSAGQLPTQLFTCPLCPPHSFPVMLTGETSVSVSSSHAEDTSAQACLVFYQRELECGGLQDAELI